MCVTCHKERDLKQSIGCRVLNGRCDSVYLHFIHLYILLILGKLEVGVIGRWSELVASQHEKDQSRHLHQKLKRHGSVFNDRN